MRRVLSIYNAGVIIAMAAPNAFSQTGSELFIVDFEGLAESTEISDQFVHLGVTFSLADNPDAFPIAAIEGSPIVAFASSAGDDTPMSSGSGGMTDPVVDGDFAVGQDILITFDPPVTSARIFVIDVDLDEVVTFRAFDNDTEVESQTVSAGDPGTGDGVSTEVFFAAENITSVLVETPDLIGYALDFLTFTRPCEGTGCASFVEIAQESAPGVADFDDNVLGVLLAYVTNEDTESFYAYDVPEACSWNGHLLTPIEDRSHLLLALTDDGMSLVVVHDRAFPDDSDGGHAEMMFELMNDDNGSFRSVEDDPEAPGPNCVGRGETAYTGEDGDSVFTSRQDWDECCTDGLALSGLDCQWSMLVQFTDVDDNETPPAFEGLTEWVAYSADGTEIPLALEEDRRVRLQATVIAKCPGDANGDGTVDPLDVGFILARFGCGPGQGDSCCDLADQNADGAVDPLDSGFVLARFGPCPLR